MTPSFVAVLPAIIPDLARRCIQSMAPELRARLLLVDNTDTGEIADEHRSDVGMCFLCRENGGVTQAWNLGIWLAETTGMQWLDAPKQIADWLYIISQSVTFGAAGGLDLLEKHTIEPHILHSQFGWHALAMHRRVWERVGRFDSAFPSYSNEVDYLRRMHLAGLPSPTENGRELTQVNINGSCLPPAQCLLRGVVKIRYADHLERYRAKWMGDKGEEKTAHPYGIESLDYTFTGDPPGWKGMAA